MSETIEPLVWCPKEKTSSEPLVEISDLPRSGTVIDANWPEGFELQVFGETFQFSHQSKNRYRSCWLRNSESLFQVFDGDLLLGKNLEQLLVENQGKYYLLLNSIKQQLDPFHPVIKAPTMIKIHETESGDYFGFATSPNITHKLTREGKLVFSSPKQYLKEK